MLVSLNVWVELTACVWYSLCSVLQLKNWSIYFSYFLMLSTAKFGNKIFVETYWYSKAAIQAIASNKQATSQIVNEARKTIKRLNKQGKTVVYQWVPSHVGIHGNKTVDLLAKKGTSLYNKQTPPNCKKIKRLIKRKTQQKFSQEATTSSRDTVAQH